MINGVNNSGSVPANYNSYSVIAQDTIVGIAVSIFASAGAAICRRPAPLAAAVLRAVPYMTAVIWIVRRLMGNQSNPSSDNPPPAYSNHSNERWYHLSRYIDWNNA